MSAIDPRIASIKKNLSKFNFALLVMSPKGGVGKTFATALLAHILSYKYNTISLLDTDLTNPTLHIVLGLNAEDMRIIEDRGIRPVKVDNKLELMSLALFVNNYSTPLRGRDIENVIKELLAVTKWSGNILLVDTPPGFSDTHLELFKLLSVESRVFITLITSPSSIALKSIERISSILMAELAKIVGILGNMCTNYDDEAKVRAMAYKCGLEYLGCIPFIDKIENYFGSGLVKILEKLGSLPSTLLKSIELLTGVKA